MNTQKGIAPGTTAGAGALAPAPDVLTINRQGVAVHLKRANPVGDALHHFEAARRRSHVGGAGWSNNYEAAVLLRKEWDRLVEDLRDQGGLLHLGRVF